MWIRDLTTLSSREIPDTDGAFAPFWASKSDFIGYSIGNTLRKVSIDGVSTITLCKIPGDLGWGAWGDDGTILFATARGRLYTVSEQGGQPELIHSHSDSWKMYPSILPEGRGLLYVSLSLNGLSLWVSTGENNRLIQIYDKAEWAYLSWPVYSQTGHLLFGRHTLDGNTIWAAPFSLSSLSVTGEPFQVAQNGQHPSVSRDGTLTYVTPGASARLMVWVDRTGAILDTIMQTHSHMDFPALSHDGNKIAFMVEEQATRNIWMYDLETKTSIPLTIDPAQDSFPTWSPEGDQIAFSSTRTGISDIYIGASDHASVAQAVVTDSLGAFNVRWSSDGQYLVYHLLGGITGDRDIWYVPLNGDRQPVPFLKTPSEEAHPHISPNGRYIAFVSNVSGRYEVYVKSFPDGDKLWPISRNGGEVPRWNGNGDELYYVKDNTMMAVKIEYKPVFRPGIPQQLFQGDSAGVSLASAPWNASFDVSQDGQRFVVIKDIELEADSNVVVVQNWIREFEDKHR